MSHDPQPADSEEVPAVPDWKAMRALFPATRTLAYLNTASFGPGPTPVLEAVQAGLAEWSEGRGSWRDWEVRAEASRGLFARLLGVETRSVALLSSLSGAASQVAESLPAPNSKGSANLVVGADEFRSNLFPWLNQERRGFEVRSVAFVDGRIRCEDLLARIDDETRLVAVSHVQSATGYRADVARLAEVCRARGVRLFLDATQSMGAIRVPTQGVDYIAVHAYKWLLAPRGAAFLYVAPDRLDEQVPMQPSWKTPSDPYENYYGGPLEQDLSRATASRLDASLAWPVWLGATRALELANELGIDAIETRNLALARRFREGLPALGLSALFEPHEASPIVSLALPDAQRVQRSLDERGVVAAVRDGHLRMSFHFFNDAEDVDRGLDALAGTARSRCGAGSSGP